MTDSVTHRFALPEEQEAIRAKCFHPSGTFIEFPREEIEQSIPERFEEIARKYPNRIAVKTRNRQLTYVQLNNAANCLAQAILTRSGTGQRPVALLLGDGVARIVAVLGVRKSGKLFVLVDPARPFARLSYMIADSQSGLVITDDAYFA